MFGEVYNNFYSKFKILNFKEVLCRSLIVRFFFFSGI